MKPIAIDFYMYDVSDIKRSAEFYEKTLGLKLDAWYGDGWVEFEIGSATLALYQIERDDLSELSNQDGGSMAIAVEDVQAAVEELRAKGVGIIFDAVESPACHYARILDPDGNAIMLHRRKDGTAG